MTESQDQQDTVPAGAPDAHSNAELDALAEIEVEGLPVATDAAPRRGLGGRFRSAIDAVLPRGTFGDQRDILGGAGQIGRASCRERV